ncbi:hypothetical protein R6Q59_017755 [Mikania micrantha]|uniref:Ataxin-2 C-terminal domain-containing protein n=1 Tax=Mikania micrantha TaxID=192012 RepID=A0A5N6M355_9ASTR|nr:hypothetical protein E3N88_36244 [Mikania micrantha]
MSLVSQRSTLNPNAPLYIPAVVRQVEDFSPEWWQLVKTSTWFHDYWLSQREDLSGNTANDYDIVDMLPDSIDTDDDLLSMEAQYEQFLHSSLTETVNTVGSPAHKQMPLHGKLQHTQLEEDCNNVIDLCCYGLETEDETLVTSLSLPKPTRGSQVETERARNLEKTRQA